MSCAYHAHGTEDRMNNVVGIGDLDKMLSELSREERDAIAKMIAEQIDDITATCGRRDHDRYGNVGGVSWTLRPFREDPQAQKSAWASVKRGIASVYLKARTALIGEVK